MCFYGNLFDVKYFTAHSPGVNCMLQITKKWETSLQKEIPQDLYEMLKQQKDACDAMIEEKNKLISDFEHVSMMSIAIFNML